MRKAFIIFAALMIIFSVSWAQETTAVPGKAARGRRPPAAGQPQQPQDVKYTNDSVARLSFVEGKTFIQRASDLGFEEGVLNMPISEGDRLGTADGRMEVHFGRGNYIRLDNDSKLDILNLPKKGDDIARMRVWSGSVYLVVGTLAKEKGIEIHTADSSFYVLDKGIYRINVRENHDTEVLVFRGLIEAAGEGRLDPGQGRAAARGRRGPVLRQALALHGRRRRRLRPFQPHPGTPNSASSSPGTPRDTSPKISRTTSPSSTRTASGATSPPYGDVWAPNGIDADWRPYWNGRWVWLGLSGWTWLPYEPWGWATFHYGRWHWGLDLGWYWIPMSMWGPAWVDWWWDDFYFGWAPMSYWGYPGILMGNRFYGGYYGAYYPSGSRALTVVRRDQLKAPNASRVAVRDTATLGSLTKMSLSSRTVNLRPSGTRISVQPINGNRVMLRKDGSSGGLVPDRGGIARASGHGVERDCDQEERGLAGQDHGSAGQIEQFRQVRASPFVRLIQEFRVRGTQDPEERVRVGRALCLGRRLPVAPWPRHPGPPSGAARRRACGPIRPRRASTARIPTTATAARRGPGRSRAGTITAAPRAEDLSLVAGRPARAARRPRISPRSGSSSGRRPRAGAPPRSRGAVPARIRAGAGREGDSNPFPIQGGVPFT